MAIMMKKNSINSQFYSHIIISYEEAINKFMNEIYGLSPRIIVILKEYFNQP